MDRLNLKNFESGLFNLVELLLLVNKAIDVVKNRRESVQRMAADQNHTAAETISTEEMLYWHNFPYLIGKVVDLSSRKPLYGAAVNLYINRKKSQPADSGWQNPYYTNATTKGLYSFFPRPVKSKAEKNHFNLIVTFEHKDYEKQSIEKKIHTRGDFEVRAYIDSDDILNLDTACLRRRK